MKISSYITSASSETSRVEYHLHLSDSFGPDPESNKQCVVLNFAQHWLSWSWYTHFVRELSCCSWMPSSFWVNLGSKKAQ